jgi:hypothetical protein
MPSMCAVYRSRAILCRPVPNPTSAPEKPFNHIGLRCAQVRALETVDGHDQTEFNRILHGIYVVGQPGRSMPQQTPWPYLPTATDTAKHGARTTDPLSDLEPRRGRQQSCVAKRLLQDVFETFDRRKKQRVRNAFWMWHGALKVGATHHLAPWEL